MLKKKYRLGSKQKIEANKSLHTDYFLLRIGKNSLPFCRFRFIVSKKIDKRAVIRNKIRRLFSKVIEDLVGKIENGYDFVFIIKKEVNSANDGKIMLSIKKLFEKEGLIK